MDLSPIIISIKTALLSIVITFLLGIFIARAVMNIKSNKLKLVVDGILTMPLVLPPTVVGFFLLYILGVNRPLGKFFLDVLNIKIVFSWTATVIAAIVVSFPLMYRASRGAFEQVNQDLIMAARTLGMSETSIFWKIIMPNALPGVASGAALAFARGMGEFGATAMIAGNISNETRTLPLAIYSEVASGNMKGAYGYVWIVLAISFVVIILMNYFILRGRNNMNRDESI